MADPEPGEQKLGRDASIQHIRQIRSQLNRSIQSDPARSPSGTSPPPEGEENRGPAAQTDATIELLEAELAALRGRVAHVEARLLELRTAAAKHLQAEDE